MPKEGSMTDRAARRAAGHASAQEEHEVEEAQEPRRKEPAAATRGTKGKRLSEQQKAILERDRAVMVGGEDDDIEGDVDDDTGTVEEDRKKKAKQPQRRRQADEEPFFTYRGRQFASQEELEDYLDDKYIEERAVRAVSRQPGPVPQAQQPAPEKEKLNFDKLVEDPETVFREFADALVTRVRSELIPAYQADRDMQNFWTTFYQDNADLAKPKLKMIVETIFMSNQDKLGPLPLDRARERLARLVRAEFRDLGIRTEGGGYTVDDEEEQPRRRRTMVEGESRGGRRVRSSGRGGEPQEQVAIQTNGEPVTLTSVLKARRAARRGGDSTLADQQ